jgi:hypothetical protein
MGTLVLLLLFGVLAFWLYFRGRDQQALRNVKAEVDRIHASGEPITPDDMANFHRVPKGIPNVTDLWLKAANMAEGAASPKDLLDASRDVRFKDMGDEKSQRLLRSIDSYLTDNQSALDAALAVAKAGGQARFPMNWGRGISDRLEHVEGFFALLRILVLRHRFALASGRLDESDESLEALLAIAASLEYEANLVGQLTRNSVLLVYCAELKMCLENRTYTDAQLEELQKTLEQLDFHKGLKLGLLGDRVCGFVAFDDPSTLQENLKNVADLPRGIDSTLGRPADCWFYLRTMREFLEAAELPLDQGHVRAMEIKAELDSVLDKGPIWQRMYKRFSAELLGAEALIFTGFARAQSQRDCSAAIVAVRRYQLNHGRLPESLDALVPEFLSIVPRDLFAAGNRPLGFIVKDGTVTVYSVGVNKVDDGGFVAESDGGQGDIALSVKMEHRATEQ